MSGPGGMGMFEKHLDSLDRITNGIRERLTINAMQAFRQRALSGDLPDVYPEDHPRRARRSTTTRSSGRARRAVEAARRTEIWESQVTDITPVLNGSKDDIKNLAAVHSTADLHALAGRRRRFR
jgi:hypothetical protein